MRARFIIILSFVTVVMAATPLHGWAQPNAWLNDHDFPSWHPGYRVSLTVKDMATGAIGAAFEAPRGVKLGQGGLTPDGRYYLAATSIGVARFHTNPPAFDRMVGPPAAVDALYVAPTGTRLHAVGAFGRAVLDWRTGAVLEVVCCTAPRVLFTPDGAIRLHIATPPGYPAPDTLVTAYSEASGALLWSAALPFVPAGQDRAPGVAAVSNSRVAIATDRGAGPEVAILDVSSGVEQGRLQHSAHGLAWIGQFLVVSGNGPALPGGLAPIRLSAFEWPDQNEIVILDLPRPGGYDLTTRGPGAIAISGDGRYAYWEQFAYIQPVSSSWREYQVVDLSTFAVVSQGSFGISPISAFEREPQCVLSVPSTVAAPAAGGIVGIPVVPGANCRPWSVQGPAILNPGPHVGPATILLQVQPNPYPVCGGGPCLLLGVQYVHIGRSVRIEQAAAPPGAPELTSETSGDRIALNWIPGVGAGITGFDVRLGARGAAPTTTRVDATVRSWTSPPLMPGSYDIEVAAVNLAGTGPASNTISVSIGVDTLPDAPIGLSAQVTDDRVALAWQPAASGPAPAGYVVEAAAEGRTDFVEVARTQASSFVAVRVPAGSWQARVRATTAGGVGPPGAPVLVTTARCTAPPGVPGSLWIQGTRTVTLRWSPPATGAAEEYVLEASNTSGGSEIRFVVPGAATVYTQSVPSGTRVFVRVRARNACGVSAASSEVLLY